MSAAYAQSPQANRLYVVREGDTLSQIIQSNLNGRIYGKKALLEEVHKLNAWLKNRDELYPGQEIDLTERERERERALTPKLIDAPIEIPDEPPSEPPAEPVIATVSPVEPQPLPKPPSFFRAWGGASALKLRAFDPNSSTLGEFVSSRFYSLGMSYEHVSSTGWEASLAVSLSRIDFLPIAGGRALSPNGTHLIEPDVQIRYRLSERFKMIFASSLAYHLSVNGLSAADLALVSTYIPQFGLGAQLIFLKSDHWELSGLVIGSFALPRTVSNFRVNSGWAERVEVAAQRSVTRKISLEAAATFRALQQNTSLTEITRSEIGGRIGIRIQLGDLPEEKETK